MSRRADPRLADLERRHSDADPIGADSEEKHEPASDIDTAVVDSLKAFDLKRPIREADILPMRFLTRLVLNCSSPPTLHSSAARKSRCLSSVVRRSGDVAPF
jgi:hypothetical protein